MDVIQRRLTISAKDASIETADVRKLAPFSFDPDCVAEVARVLAILIVHILKSPVIVTPTFHESLSSVITSQPSRPDGASSSPSLSSSPSSPSSPSATYPLDVDHVVDCLSALNTIRALCIPGLFQGIATSVRTANFIIEAVNSGKENHLKDINAFFDIAGCPALPYSSGAVRQKEPGSWLFDSSIGPIQVGIPPETIKTSMKNKESVPQIYILPHIMCASGGTSYGEVEFPIYFNFFIKKAMSNPDARVVMVGSASQLHRVQTIFKESMFGPNEDELFIDEEIIPAKKESGYNIDFLAERSILAYKGANGREVTISDFASFVAFDEHGEATTSGPTLPGKKRKHPDSEDNAQGLGKVKIVNSGGLIKFIEDGEIRGSVDSTLLAPTSTNNHASVPAPLSSAFVAPTLGVTFLGTSHGFDPNGSTTGFIIWVNGNGILVDPPTQTGAYLAANGISPQRVNTVILTHCHSDHDSGILQRILEGGKIDLYTTRTINESYRRKARAITGRADIDSYYNWVSVRIGEPTKIHGATFEFDYSLHTIPTIRFRLRFQGKSMSYSADTKYDTACYAKLLAEGTISTLRESSLRMFVFDSDLIIHESGVPPIHTDASELDALPASVKRKLLVVHTHNIPETVMRGGKPCKVEGLRIPRAGLENTITLNVGEFSEGYSKALRRFNLFCECFIFRRVSPFTIYKLLSVAEDHFFPAGTEIISQGATSDRAYLLETGQVEVRINGTAKDTLTVGAIFGENALLQTEKHTRSASVIAVTDVNVLVIDNVSYFKLVDNGETSIEMDLGKISQHVAFLQSALTKAFPGLGLTKQQLEAFSAAIDRQITYTKDSVIIREGDTDTSMFIIKQGSVRLERFNKEIRRLYPGDCFGEISTLTGLPRTASAIANEDSVILELKREAFQELMDRYQHIRFHVVQMMEQRLVEGKRLNYIINK